MLSHHFLFYSIKPGLFIGMLLAKTVTCGCPNMATIRGDKVSAVDLSRIVMLNSIQREQKSNFLSSQDLAFQEARRQRKVKRLDFEVR